MPKKIIDEVVNGWVTAAEPGGQIELVQSDQLQSEELVGQGDTLTDAQLDQRIEDDMESGRLPSLSDIPDDDEDEDWLDDEDDEDLDEEPRGFTNRPVSSSYHSYGSPYKNTCIICGKEFESPRPARFCVDNAACRQKFNRQERAVKAAAASANASIGELLKLLADQNFGKLARELLLQLETATLQRLDDKLPDRHPKKVITATPVRVDPAELSHGDKVFVMVGKTIRAVKVYGPEGDDLVECGEINANGYGAKLMLVQRDVVWLRVVEPDEQS
jgi:rRNA maturation protein Nop10